MFIDQPLTSATETSVKQALLDKLASCDELVVDLSRVEGIDTVGFQLMLTAKMEAARLHKAIHFVEHSQAILGVLVGLNEGTFLGDPIVTVPTPARPSN